MSLEELLRNRTIMRIKPNHNLAVNSIKRARRDIDTAQTLITNQKFDWALAVAYNAMLTAGRAIMIFPDNPKLKKLMETSIKLR
ncbi:MAG TPA: hypothetical protein VJ249_12235 [Candidatus Bathyarchaeia archaeon]|nr:hypothetical protein [Candidatus Bathyarchaeia archaeon]